MGASTSGPIMIATWPGRATKRAAYRFTADMSSRLLAMLSSAFTAVLKERGALEKNESFSFTMGTMELAPDGTVTTLTLELVYSFRDEDGWLREGCPYMRLDLLQRHGEIYVVYPDTPAYQAIRGGTRQGLVEHVCRVVDELFGGEPWIETLGEGYMLPKTDEAGRD